MFDNLTNLKDSLLRAVDINVWFKTCALLLH